MATIHCPKCGEEYSDTYKTCPFCEEEAARQEGRSVHRHSGGRRAAPSKGPNILTPVLIIVIVILALLLGYLFFGDAIRDRMSSGGAASSAQSSQSGGSGSLGAVSSADPGVILEPDVSAPEGGTSAPETSAGTEPDDGESSAAEIAKLPKTLTVNNPDFTLPAGESYTVKVTAGGSGPYTWLSSDDGVASVDENGKVTAIAKGKAEITVADGTGRGGCVVYVKGGAAAANPAPTTPTTPAADSKNAKLSTDDFTTHVGDPDVKLKLSGVTTAPTWTSKNPAVAAVSADGTVKAVGKGTTTVTASWDGGSLACIVRVS